MAYSAIGGFPPQQLSFSKKNKAWRKKCVDFGDAHSLLYYDLTRMDVRRMDINYDLVKGIVHMSDLKMLINPFDIQASFIPDNIQHYSIINSKMEVLKGEESRRLFDYKVVVTNPNAISEIEEAKNNEVNQRLQELIMDTAQSEEDFQKALEKQDYYFQYQYQDKREVRANRVLNHYAKELEFNQMFNRGFWDVMVVAEELYQCDIVGGEPHVEKLDPRDVRIITDGTSHRIEDADMIIIEQYWSKGKIYDTYWDQLSKKDRETLEEYTDTNRMNNPYTDSMDNLDSRYGFIRMGEDWVAGDAINPYDLFNEEKHHSKLPYDEQGNIRVLRVYWKSRRKIKKVKSYDPVTGEEEFNFYPENYIINPDKGEEEEIFWVNQAWEGTKIGSDIYLNMRPRPVQYNRLSNPSRCHFGIIGQIYSNSGDAPFSLVDIMKPYAYLYDVVHDRLNKLLARNHGKIVRMDFAKVPKSFNVDKWLYYITVNGIAVEDSFKEGDKGAATGKLAAGLNNASNGVIDASLGSEIQQHLLMLDWIDSHTGKLAGISDQRLGQISNRETVGGVERSTLQSSHSTEWLFFPHESVKKRVLECFLETAKIAFKGRKLKFSYMMEDGAEQLIEIDGDEFAECDYGLVVDNSSSSQILNQQLDTLAQAGLQNGMSFSTIMKLYTTTSLAEKQRLVEQEENRRMEQQQQQQQQEYQLQQQKIQMDAQQAQQKLELEYKMHQEDNETKIMVAQINASAEEKRFQMIQEENGMTKQQEIQYKDKQLELDAEQFKQKLALDKTKHEADIRIKERQLAKSK